jgi:hypothetical protein
MILCKENNFLLLKNFEVNGDYIESVLSNLMPENAIVTSMKNPTYYYEPRNYHEYEFTEYMTYYEINKKYNLADCKAYIIVRNPYHTVLSNFFYSIKTLGVLEKWNKITEKEKKEFVDGYFNTDFFIESTKELYIYDNMIMVEDVIIYEDGIEEQINKILTKHNLKNIKLKEIEDLHVPKDLKFWDVFSEEQINQITESWKWEFDNFGYERWTK